VPPGLPFTGGRHRTSRWIDVCVWTASGLAAPLPVAAVGARPLSAARCCPTGSPLQGGLGLRDLPTDFSPALHRTGCVMKPEQFHRVSFTSRAARARSPQCS